MSAQPATPTVTLSAMPVWRQYYVLTKPRVVQLIVFCALIGMVLAVPGLPSGAALRRMLSPAPASGWWPARQRRSTA